MRNIVLRFGLASGALLVALIILPLAMSKGVVLDHGEIIGYSAMVLSFLLVFFGIRSYRDNVAGGAIGFGEAFRVGLLITLAACAVYVIAWQITYFNFLPDFFDQYTTHVLAKMRAAGESEAAIREKAAQMAEMGRLYQNPLFNAGVTLLEVFPVGLIMTLVSAAILRRGPGQEEPAAVAAGQV